jgi:hypothetical protein
MLLHIKTLSSRFKSGPYVLLIVAVFIAYINVYQNAFLYDGRLQSQSTFRQTLLWDLIAASAAVDPSGFAELSLCDRHAFAPSAPRNRTAIVPSREKRMQSCPAASSRRFLRSGLRVCIAAFGPFPAILAAIRRNFSAIQTAWRRGRDSILVIWGKCQHFKDFIR